MIVYDRMVSEVAMVAAITRTTSASGSAIMNAVDTEDGGDAQFIGDRVWLLVLCLLT